MSIQTLKLSFANTFVGHHLHALRSHVGRLTEIQKRSNFWSTRVTLDGAYPDLVWQHAFQVYFGEGTGDGTPPVDFLSRYVRLANLYSGSSSNLFVTDDSTNVVGFGSCYMEDFAQQEPEELLLYGAGILELKFIGTSIPTVY